MHKCRSILNVHINEWIKVSLSLLVSLISTMQHEQTRVIIPPKLVLGPRVPMAVKGAIAM